MINVRKSNLRAAVAGFALIGCAVAGMTVVTARPAAAQAAADTNADKPISINMQNTPIQAVLKALFNSVGANYSIDADVAGNVNITMNNVGFLAALRSILHATTPPLTYDYTDGVYHIRVKKTDIVQPTTNPVVDGGSGTTPGNGGGGNLPTTGARFYKMPVDHYDVLEMAKLISNSSQKIVEAVPSGIGASAGQGGGQQGGGGVGMGNPIGGGVSGGGGGMGMGMGSGGMGGGYGGGRGF